MSSTCASYSISGRCTSYACLKLARTLSSSKSRDQVREPNCAEIPSPAATGSSGAGWPGRSERSAGKLSVGVGRFRVNGGRSLRSGDSSSQDHPRCWPGRRLTETGPGLVGESYFHDGWRGILTPNVF